MVARGQRMMSQQYEC